MKKKQLSIIFFALGMLFFTFPGCQKGHKQELNGYYTCSMHPQVIAHEPGDCPICHMKLTFVSTEKKNELPKNKKNDTDSFQFFIAANILLNSNLATAPVQKEMITRKMRYSAHVDYNEAPSHLVVINTKYDGWVESLSVTKEGQKVFAGQNLMGIYSPNILAAKEEYITTYNTIKNLYLAQNKKIDEIFTDPTLKASRRKLQYLDISDFEISQLEKESSAPRRSPYYSPISGVIVKKNILQGAFIKAGDEILRIANLSTLWVYIHIFDKDLPFISAGQNVSIQVSAYPDKSFNGKIDLIYPFLDSQTKDIKVRIVVPNDQGLLKPGMFAEVQVETKFPQALLSLPETSVIYSGDKNYVFLSLGDGHFELRPVTIKFSSEARTIVSAGVKANDMVVTNGQFLLDSEASLKELVGKNTAKPGISDLKNKNSLPDKISPQHQH